MPATDTAALSKRIDRVSEKVREDIGALSDDILKVQETVDQHTDSLAALSKGQADLSKGQADLSKGQADLSRGLAEMRAGQSAIGHRLNAYAMRLNGLELDSRKNADSLHLHTDILDRHSNMLTEILERLPPRAS